MKSFRKLPLLLVIGLVSVALAAWVKIPRKTGAVAASAENQFPSVAGTNLDRVDLEFPRDFAKPLNVVFIAFQQWQQGQVNSWVPTVQALEAESDDIIYYEFPTVWEMSMLRRTFLNEGMRAGIPDQTSRERTITLYLDKAGFKNQLDIPTEDTMVLLLVRQDGTVLWRTDGAVTNEKAAALEAAILSNR